MQEIIFRFDPDNPPAVSLPASSAEARQRLEEGNRVFAGLLDPDDSSTRSCVIPLDPRQLGFGETRDTIPEQKPFAAVLSCSDARVPTELIFHQAGNDLFVSRVAGNVLGDECLGSLQYAAAHLDSIRLYVVLGHSVCGAVTAAVDAFLDPARYPLLAPTQSLRSIIGSLVIAVRGAAMALAQAWGESVAQQTGYRTALIETAVASHAALTAWTLKRELQIAGVTERSEVVYGVYDLMSRFVRLPVATKGIDAELSAPPADSTELAEHTVRVAAGDYMRGILSL